MSLELGRRGRAGVLHHRPKRLHPALPCRGAAGFHAVINRNINLIVSAGRRVIGHIRHGVEQRVGIETDEVLGGTFSGLKTQTPAGSIHK